MNFIYDYISVVPAPIITISANPTSPLYTGMELFLTCTLTLHSNVDNEVILSSVWRRGGRVLTSNSRVNITSVTMIRQSVYQTTLIIRPLSSTLDNGQYSCQSDIASENFVLYEQGMQQKLIGIGGVFMFTIFIIM